MVKQPEAPVIWEYRNARIYLNDLATWKKTHERGFSFRKISFLADLGSPNYVQMYLAGRRNFKHGTAQQVGEAFGLNVAEQEFFATMVKFSQSEDEEDRRRWYTELLQKAVAQGVGKLDAARLDYFQCWYIPVIHAMASLDGFRPEARWIAEHVVPPIRIRQARHALKTLEELSILIVKGKDVRVEEARLETEEGIRSIWIREYHRAMIRLAEQSLDTWPAEYRTTSAVTVTVPRASIAEVLSWVDAYRKDVFSRIQVLQADMKDIDGEVLQINFQAFPVSDIEENQFSKRGEEVEEDVD